MPALVLGPLLRYVGTTDATVWVETDAACEVEVLGHREPTFGVAGRHYALVHVSGLRPGSRTPYEVALDGGRAWPPEDAPHPPSTIRTGQEERAVRIAFGSCRTAYPQDPPYGLPRGAHPQGRGGDALRALAMRIAREDAGEAPDALLMLGDQIYADDVAPATREFIRGRRDPAVPPGETVADYHEYAELYREAWSEPWIRWLLSTVPTAMVFDDHDVHDDWNTSQAWVRRMRASGWWDERITAAFMSYWVYQHLGNLDPQALGRDETYRRVRGSDDAEAHLRAFGWGADRRPELAQWSFRRDIGPARLVMVDTRAARVVTPGRRRMVDDAEWRFVRDSAGEPRRHLLLGSSVPWLLARGMHDLEAWNEAVVDGAWGRWWRRPAEWIRQRLDLEHWAAFQASFRDFCGMVEEIGAGVHGPPPATVVALSGDVHHAYLMEVGFPRSAGVRSRVYQAVCSPFRNPLDAHERAAVRFATSRAGALVGRLLRRAARLPAPPVRWRTTHGAPWFENMVATLHLEGDRARVRFDRVAPGGEPHDLRLERVYERDL